MKLGKLLPLGITILLAATALSGSMTVAGCQSSGASEQTAGRAVTTVASSMDREAVRDMAKKKADDINRQALVAKITFNQPAYMPSEPPEPMVYTWAQDGLGSWRVDYDTSSPGWQTAPAGAPTVIIYSAPEQKGWFIAGDTAYEATASTSLGRESNLDFVGAFLSPAMALIEPPSFSLFSTEQDADGNDVAWVWRNTPPAWWPPQTETATTGESFYNAWSRVELLGPQGLISRVQGGTGNDDSVNTLSEYLYLQTGSVDPSAFSLPAEVKEIKPYSELQKLQDQMPPQ